MISGPKSKAIQAEETRTRTTDEDEVHQSIFDAALAVLKCRRGPTEYSGAIPSIHFPSLSSSSSSLGSFLPTTHHRDPRDQIPNSFSQTNHRKPMSTQSCNSRGTRAKSNTRRKYEDEDEVYQSISDTTLAVLKCRRGPTEYASASPSLYLPLLSSSALSCPSSNHHKNFGQWDELMGDNAIVTATLDWLLHHAQVIVLKGESYVLKDRMKLGLVPCQET